mmetsp:Transcript_27051/g.65638  ORF Transcript_27051/g.65638 Transcript_27051/m.65638 type:complete len:157 (-) Transcript_27051:34-504(-)
MRLRKLRRQTTVNRPLASRRMRRSENDDASGRSGDNDSSSSSSSSSSSTLSQAEVQGLVHQRRRQLKRQEEIQEHLEGQKCPSTTVLRTCTFATRIVQKWSPSTLRPPKMKKRWQREGKEGRALSNLEPLSGRVDWFDGSKKIHYITLKLYQLICR